MSTRNSDMIPQASADEDTLRILLATDIHLGYAEKHPVKADDSFNTFDEILAIAKEQAVDMLLLGGDLFHENKPSRNSELRCIDILQKHILGDSVVSLEFLSDPDVNFAHCQRRLLNYMDPNMNIDLPVFSIHGNHDDPSGLGGHSCMDLMHSTGLINYFGRIENLNNITVSPLLIKKGNTRLALYGMSAMKDERLHRLFRSNKVKMLRPEEDTEDWFNLLVLHQNRAKHGAYNYIPEHFIDGFVDLVFWGHEHECRLEPEAFASGDKSFFITQPGSPVATSLCEGEAKEKKVGLLTVQGKRFKIEGISLKTVRPMVFDTVNLDTARIDLNLSYDEKKTQQKIELYLRSRVDEMISEADQKLTGHPNQPQLPLIRLRVEYSDESHQLTPGRFGNHYHDKVANPSDILLFRKKVVDRKKNDTDFSAEHMDNLLQTDHEGPKKQEENLHRPVASRFHAECDVQMKSPIDLAMLSQLA